MLREIRANDAPRFVELFQRLFPEEDALLGSRPADVERIVRRIFRWDVRLILGFLDLIRRPVFRAFALDVDGTLVATAILTFTERAGYVSSVMVDTPYRRQGMGRRVVTECVEATRRVRKPYVVLDVVATNDPAIRLYERLGFRPLRELAIFVKEESGAFANSSAPPPQGVREFRRSDAAHLVDIVRASLSAVEAEVLPPSRTQVTVSSFVLRGLESTSKAWVLEDNGAPVGFVRATVSGAMTAGHLSAPVVAPSVDPARAEALVRWACKWIAGREKTRVIAEAPLSHGQSKEALRAGGFHEAYRVATLFRPTSG